MEEAIEIIRQFDKKADDRMKPFTVVFGAYKGPIDAAADEKVIFIGDCANWQGKLGNEYVDIKSLYKERHHLDPHKAVHDDIFGKMASVYYKLFKRRKSQVVRARGCPVSVAEQALYITRVGNTKNPYLDLRASWRFNIAYVVWRVVIAVKRLLGRSYQIGVLSEAERGEAPHGPPVQN